MATDLLTELRGLHGPPTDLSALITDGTIALAIGLLTSWGIAKLINLVTIRRVSPEQEALRRLEKIQQTSGIEDLTARAHLLQKLSEHLPDKDGDWLHRVDDHLGGFLSQGSGKGLRDALYKPGALLDIERFDSELKTSLERAGR